MPETHISNITGRIRLEADAPSAPQAGDVFYDTENHSLFRYTGNNWLGFHFSGNPASTAPNSQNEGTHFSSLTRALRTGTANPTDPKEGDIWYNTSTDVLSIYESGAWFTAQFTTTTSTSTSTTTTSTSTSTTTTSTSTSSSTSSSTSTSTSTTTTL